MEREKDGEMEIGAWRMGLGRGVLVSLYHRYMGREAEKIVVWFVFWKQVWN